MYELGHRSRKVPYKFIGAGIALVVLAGCILTYKVLNLTTAPQSNITNGVARTTDYQPGIINKVSVEKPAFRLSLPAGWAEVTNSKEKFSQGGYDFRSPGGDARLVSVYIDDIPASLAINRALVVTAKDDHVTYGTVSDNCATYTRPSKAEPGSGRATGLWQGANFICDLGNYERNVTGTVSTDGVNYFKMQDPRGKSHEIFLAYTDNGPSPNFSVFYALLDSFRLR